MISVVVPVYNVATYLAQSLESILAQTFTDLEILVVDDGSTDGSAQLCDEYAAKDLRVKVIHKANGGLSDARNVGMSQAKGDWLFFADSDDWLAPEALARLHAFAVANDCDAVQGGIYYAYADHLLCRKASRRERAWRVLGREEAMRALIRNDRVKNFAWGKLYKTELVRELDFPVGRYFEDCFWQHRVLDRVARYGILDEPLYYYRQRPESISGCGRHLRDLEEGYRCRLAFVERNYPQLQPLMQAQLNRLLDQQKTRHPLEKWCRRLIAAVGYWLLPKKYVKIPR